MEDLDVLHAFIPAEEMVECNYIYVTIDLRLKLIHALDIARHKFTSYIFAIRLLNEPRTDLEDTFSNHAYTFTIHAHLHLIEKVRLHGPLKCHSASFSKVLYLTLKIYSTEQKAI